MISWQEAAGDVDHYLIQWRPHYEDFSENHQRRVNPADLSYIGVTPNRRFSLQWIGIDSYAMRILAVNDAGSTASDEVPVMSDSNKIRRLMEQYIVAEHKDEYPWLEEVWAHINGPEFVIYVGNFGVSKTLISFRNSSPINSLTAYGFKFRPSHANESFFLELPDHYLHEIIHVYIATNGIASRPGSLGLAHLYFSRMVNEADSDWCKDKAQELYADTGAALVFPTPNTYYWVSSCTPPGIYAPTEEALEVVRQAFSGQIPDWVYANYQRDDGELDLEMIWAEVRAMNLSWARTLVVYQLRDEFGGYCDPLQASLSASGYSDVRNPWRDGGLHPLNNSI